MPTLLTILAVVYIFSTVLLTLGVLVLRTRVAALENAPVKRDVRIADLEIECEKLSGQVRAAVGRLDRSRRPEKAQETPEEEPAGGALPRQSGESVDDWKRRARKAMASGTLKHHN